MQALQKLAVNALFRNTSNLIGLQAVAPAGNLGHSALREYSSNTKKVAKDEGDGNAFTDGVKSTIGTLTKKAKEAFGSQKQVGAESQEPAGVMENRDADGENQPQSRYKEVAGKAKEQWGDKKVTDLYQDANKNANATAESAKTKAKDNAKTKA